MTGGLTHSAPTATTRWSTPPSRPMTRAADSTSCSAAAPFIARNRPPLSHQRHRPTREPVHRSHRSRRHHIEHSLTVELLGPPPMDGHVGQFHCGGSQVQKRGTTQQRLHQSHLKIRSPDRQGDSGQAGPAADVAHGAALGHQLGDHRAVQDVPLPESRNLPGPDQATHGGLPREQVGELLRHGSRCENTPCALGGAGGVSGSALSVWFHVKRHRQSSDAIRGVRRRNAAARPPRTPK